MSFLENLRSLLNIDVDLSKLKTLRVKLFSDNSLKDLFHIDNRTITINLSNVPPKKTPELQKILKSAVLNEDHLLLEEKAQSLVNEITIFESDPSNLGLVKFFRGKLPGNDIEILRAAVIIKDLYDKGEQVRELKRDLQTKYGDRGNNIANLCTANYFETIIKPLYEQMCELEDFTIERFTLVYNTIVMNSPFAIFVNSHLSLEQLEYEVQKKMEKNKKYGINYLNLHGIGEENIDKITEIIVKFKKYFAHTPTIDSGRGYITVIIYF